MPVAPPFRPARMRPAEPGVRTSAFVKRTKRSGYLAITASARSPDSAPGRRMAFLTPLPSRWSISWLPSRRGCRWISSTGLPHGDSAARPEIAAAANALRMNRRRSMRLKHRSQCELNEPRIVRLGTDHTEGGVSRGQSRLSELHPVKEIKEFRPELHAHPLGDLRCLE